MPNANKIGLWATYDRVNGTHNLINEQGECVFYTEANETSYSKLQKFVEEHNGIEQTPLHFLIEEQIS